MRPNEGVPAVEAHKTAVAVSRVSRPRVKSIGKALQTELGPLFRLVPRSVISKLV